MDQQINRANIQLFYYLSYCIAPKPMIHSTYNTIHPTGITSVFLRK